VSSSAAINNPQPVRLDRGNSTRELGATEWFSAHIYLERLGGDAKSYRNALHAYLSYLESHRRNEGVIFDPHVAAVDTAITEARLAVLEESQGNQAESQRYFQLAASHCPSGWTGGCPPQRLRDLVSKLDRNPQSETQGSK